MEANQEAREQVVGVNRAIQQHLTEKEEVVHFDETGARAEGQVVLAALGQYGKIDLLCHSSKTRSVGDGGDRDLAALEGSCLAR